MQFAALPSSVLKCGGRALRRDLLDARNADDVQDAEHDGLVPIGKRHHHGVFDDGRILGVLDAKNIAAAAAILGCEVPIASEVHGAADAVRASLVKPANDGTPFLFEQVRSNPAWDIVLPKIRLSIPYGDGNKAITWQESTYMVRLAPENGALISIMNVLSSEDKDAVAPYPDATLATDYIHRGGNETFHAFCDAPPKHTLSNVLGIIHTHMGVPDCKQLVVHCVVWSMMDREPRVAWSVDFRGYEPEFDINLSSPAVPNLHPNPAEPYVRDMVPIAEADSDSGIPLSMRNHLRHTVFDDNGMWYTAGTSPQPARLLDWEIKRIEVLQAERAATDAKGGAK